MASASIFSQESALGFTVVISVINNTSYRLIETHLRYPHLRYIKNVLPGGRIRSISFIN